MQQKLFSVLQKAIDGSESTLGDETMTFGFIKPAS